MRGMLLVVSIFGSIAAAVAFLLTLIEGGIQGMLLVISCFGFIFGSLGLKGCCSGGIILLFLPMVGFCLLWACSTVLRNLGSRRRESIPRQSCLVSFSSHAVCSHSRHAAGSLPCGWASTNRRWGHSHWVPWSCGPALGKRSFWQSITDNRPPKLVRCDATVTQL